MRLICNPMKLPLAATITLLALLPASAAPPEIRLEASFAPRIDRTDRGDTVRYELRLTNIVTTEMVADVLPLSKGGTPVAELGAKIPEKGQDKRQDRFPSASLERDRAPSLSRTAEALPTNTVAAKPQQ